jgi:sigma-E factor negative regulatory protein RseC
MAGLEMSEMGYIVHDGRVSEVKKDVLMVTLDVGDACSACHVKGACGMSEQEDKVITISRNGNDFGLNERVRIKMKQDLGLKAIFLAYVLPFLIVLTFLILLLNYFSEWQAAVMTLVVLAIYYLGLSHYNKQIAKAFNVQIERL